ncbi:ABC transporter substrate-binding protein [Desulforapulum autotrophicum]|uniref:ABC transporter substrate-binding protein n=1 Tax=Desulforapulum autotrophicum TaxID=2296 RepID=UPI00164FC97C|nr:ABC transporter substrate-binding protein [Desulforapulum autotrophicum]
MTLSSIKLSRGFKLPTIRPFLSCLVFFLLFFPSLLTLVPDLDAADNKQSVVLQLAWKHQFQFAGYYAALEKGYYRDAGLEVTLVQGGEGRFAREELLDGRAQYGVAGAELILHRAGGDPFVVLAPIFQHSPSILLIRADSGISSFQGLVGKRVMLLPGTKDADILAAFQNEGIDESEFIRLDQSYDLNDLINGRTDCVSAYSTNEPWLLEQAGVKPGILLPRTYGVDFYSDCLFTTDKEIAAHPDRAARFLRASLQGWEYAMANREETIDLIINRYKVNKSKDHLRHESEAMEKLMLPDLVEIGHMSPGRWRHIANTYAALGMLDPEFDLQGFLYTPDAAKDHSRLRWTVFILFMVSLATTVIAIALSIFNKKLKKESLERKRAVKALQESETKFKEFMAHFPGYAFIKNGAGKYLYVNKAVSFGANSSPEQRLGKTDDEIFSPAVAKVLRANDAEVLDTLQSIEVHEKITDEEGHYRTTLVVKFPITRERNAPLIGGIALDVTEGQEMQKMLVQSEKMLSVGGLAAGMAHELNSPLGGIVQSVQVIHNRFTRDLPANRRAAEALGLSMEAIKAYMEKRDILKLLASIREAGARAAHIIENMLSFSHKPGGHFSIHNLSDLLDNTVELAGNDYNLKKQYDFKDIEIMRKYDPTMPGVPCEGNTIQQVFLNILRNGAEAMVEARTEQIKHQGSDLGISKNRFTLRTKQETDMACVEITDNGPGMDEKTKQCVFDPFFTTKPIGTGTGLGLSVSYFIIRENHGGEMEVRSEPGRGTTFIIRLPFQTPSTGLTV